MTRGPVRISFRSGSPVPFGQRCLPATQRRSWPSAHPSLVQVLEVSTIHRFPTYCSQ